ncbi:MAG: hypothetical protein LBP35_03650 [Candidatus Ancillula trichonymphae]|jgi:putative ABC transport system permease protein|nr:hypothetical protein [Candidatus Ancillula trichonymphae]
MMSIFGRIVETLSSAQANLFRSKMRTILTIVAVIVGSFTISLVTALNTWGGVNEFIGRQMDAIGSHNSLYVAPEIEKTASSEPKEYVPADNLASARKQTTAAKKRLYQADKEKIEGIKNVKRVQETGAINATYIEYNGGKKYQFSAGASVDGIRLDVLAGSRVNSESSEPEVDLSLDCPEPLGLIQLDGSNDTARNHAQEVVGKTVQIVVQNLMNQKLHECAFKVTGVLNSSLVLVAVLCAERESIQQYAEFHHRRRSPELLKSGF